MRITIQGLGVVGGFGCGVPAFSGALARGSSPLGTLQAPSARGPVEIPAFLADAGPLERFVPKRTLRRIDHFSRLALLGAHLALEDAGALTGDHGGLGVIIATGHGATGTTLALIDSIIGDGDVCASPIHFAGSLHNSPAAHISILLGAKGPSLTVSQFHLSVPSALLAAQLWLRQGRVDRVLFGAVDELSALSAHLWAREHELEKPLGLRPGGIPGEGAAFLLLSSREEACPPYCALEAVATGRDAAAALPQAEVVFLQGAPGWDGPGTRRLDPVVGTLPVGPGFDVAAGALLLREGRGAGTVACVTVDDGGNFGRIRLDALGGRPPCMERGSPGA